MVKTHGFPVDFPLNESIDKLIYFTCLTSGFTEDMVKISIFLASELNIH